MLKLIIVMDIERGYGLKRKVLELIANKESQCLYSLKLNPDWGFGKLEYDGYIKVEKLSDSCYASITEKGKQYLKHQYA